VIVKLRRKTVKIQSWKKYANAGMQGREWTLFSDVHTRVHATHGVASAEYNVTLESRELHLVPSAGFSWVHTNDRHADQRTYRPRTCVAIAGIVGGFTHTA